MKKMKFLAFMLSAAFLATTFTACTDEEEGEIIIKVTEKPESVIIGDEFTVSYTVESDKNLKSIDVLVNNKDIPGAAITKFENKLQYIGKITYTAEEAGELSFSIKVVDKDGAVQYENFKIEAKEETTALGEWTEVELVRPGSTANDAINLEYKSNLDGNKAKFVTISAAKDLVIVDNGNFETVESLKEAYDAGAKVADFNAKSDANFKQVFYITVVGEDYVLVDFYDLKFAEGNNKAFFKYKK